MSALLLSFYLPLVSFAAGGTQYTRTIDSTNAKSFVNSLTGVLRTWGIRMLVLFALVNFIYVTVQYIAADESTDKKEKGQRVVWGVIALFVMLSVWALVGVIANTFGLTEGGTLEGWNS